MSNHSEASVLGFADTMMLVGLLVLLALASQVAARGGGFEDAPSSGEPPEPDLVIEIAGAGEGVFVRDPQTDALRPVRPGELSSIAADERVRWIRLLVAPDAPYGLAHKVERELRSNPSVLGKKLQRVLRPAS